MRFVPHPDGTGKRQTHSPSRAISGTFLWVARRHWPPAAPAASRRFPIVMTSLRIQLFARFRDLLGGETIALDLPDRPTVRDLRSALNERRTGVVFLLERSRIAVNGEFADDDVLLNAFDEIAIIPPVSGGGR